MTTTSENRPLAATVRLGRLFLLLPLLALLLAAPGTALAKYASIVIDAETGEILHAASADTRNFPASMTKMMTLYMTFDALDARKLTLDQRLKVSSRAAGMAPSKLGLKPGETIRTEDCILSLVTKSANDCAVVLAEAIGGTETEFARMMTDRARALGMRRTTFRNASGLPNAGQLSTARDMARLAQALIQDHAKYYPYFSTRQFTYKGVTHGNHNRLMARYRGMDGLKTGFIRASGFNLAASAVRDGRRLIGVVFGGETAVWRDNHMADLLDKAFEGRATPMLVASAERVQAPGKASRRTPASPTPGRKPDESGSVVTAMANAAEAVARSAGDLQLVSSAIAAPAAPAAKKAPGGWGIQVGAFNDRSASQRAVANATQRAPALLDRAIPHVMEVSTGKGSLYRARLMGLDEKTARRACAQLAKAGQGCLTVPPQQGL
ncbi:D-alanyl-D-alanine carboxypeptidase [Rhodospirillum centenum]|uniref:D-alanyl-D-alanine carboxypeptidase n=1 Tax=Rhodospirillum centenum TaxID=34018 RepID=UPI0017B3AD52|nr:D-alanyl-D-alanine carboxypeptidase [Rhodospirillum centenum]